MASIAPKPLSYTDLSPTAWRDDADLQLGSMWLFPARDRQNGHALDYHGNCVPQILTQLLRRYTRRDDVVLDLFLGSGTSAIEAAHLGRRALGVELQPALAQHVVDKLTALGVVEQTRVLCGDSSDGAAMAPTIKQALAAWQLPAAQFLFLHPPYADIIRFSDHRQCLSNAPSEAAFLDAFERVCALGFELLAPGRFAALVIGDKYARGEWIPLGFRCLERMNRVGFVTKSIIVKNITGNEVAKGRQENLWRYRALRGGFYLFKHEYVMVFQKPGK
jgi:DNA modification methylase